MLKAAIKYVNCRYGSKRGLISRLTSSLGYRVGQYSALCSVPWTEIDRLVFVCSGNICRSPLAEAQARALDIDAVSYGLHCSDNHPADLRVVAFAQGCKLDLRQHRTQHIRHYRPMAGDLLVGMEPRHAVELKSLFGAMDIRITLVGLWLASPRPYIHDPFSSPPEFFDRCERDVINGVKNIKARLGGR